MQRPYKAKNAARHITVTLLAIALVCYFAYHAINGERGILAFFKLNHQLTAMQQKLEQLRLERLGLEHTVSLMRPDALDLDLLDEQARQTLGYAAPGEQVYIIE